MGNCCSTRDDEDSLQYFDRNIIAVTDMDHGDLLSSQNQEGGEENLMTSNQSSSHKVTSPSVSDSEKQSWSFSYSF